MTAETTSDSSSHLPMSDGTPIIQSRASYQVTSFADFRTTLGVEVEEIESILPQERLTEQIVERVSGLSERKKENQGYRVPVRRLTDLPREAREQLVDECLSEVEGDVRAAILANRDQKYMIISGKLVDTIVELSESTTKQLQSTEKYSNSEKSSV